jgi:multidrug transporter EmrE-like cation transporter
MSAVRGFFSGVFCFLLFDALVLLGLIISLNLTILNPDFVTAELEKLDVYSAVIEQAKTRLPSQQFISAATVDELVSELTPWFEEQANTVIHTVYGYLNGEQEMEVTISLEPVRTAVKEKVTQAVINSLPPELQGASQSQIDAYMSQVYTGIDNVIPSSFVLNEAVAGSQVMTQLEQVKKIVGYIDTAYKALIAAAILLVLLIALVYWWQPKPITRSIGITFILVGVACILGPLLDYLIVQVLGQFIGTSGMISGLQAKLPQLVADLTAPLRVYGIGFLVSGIALIVISVLFRSTEVRPGVSQT